MPPVPPCCVEFALAWLPPEVVAGVTEAVDGGADVVAVDEDTDVVAVVELVVVGGGGTGRAEDNLIPNRSAPIRPFRYTINVPFGATIAAGSPNCDVSICCPVDEFASSTLYTSFDQFTPSLDTAMNRTSCGICVIGVKLGGAMKNM